MKKQNSAMQLVVAINYFSLYFLECFPNLTKRNAWTVSFVPSLTSINYSSPSQKRIFIFLKNLFAVENCNRSNWIFFFVVSICFKAISFNSVCLKLTIRTIYRGFRYPVSIYLLKVNNRNTRIRCGICPKLTIKTLLLTLLLTLNIFHTLF